MNFINASMRYVMAYSQAVAESTKSKIYPEHILVGILKLSGLTAADIFPVAGGNTDEIRADIGNINIVLSRAGLSTTPRELRFLLRRSLLIIPPMGDAEAAVSGLFSRVSKNTKMESALITPADVLADILSNPPDTIRPFLYPESSAGNVEGTTFRKTKNDEKLMPGGQSDETDNVNETDSLSELMEDISSIRYELLNTVLGQDHAVHAFAEGIFQSAVFYSVDKESTRPKALFVFAGPPGVGKTFLAKTAAAKLGLSFKSFDMSNYSDHQSNNTLIGFNSTYKDAQPGVLTKYAAENPDAVLLFDEIEKAHVNTINLFLQILDEGRLHDEYYDKDVAFRDTIIIFTTNAGRQLYESGSTRSAAGISRQVIIDALKTDTDSRTGAPFFPAAITSRMATGYTVMFNNLSARDLAAITAIELKRMAGMTYDRFKIDVQYDNLLAPILLFAEGGLVDARTISAQAQSFFKNELLKLFQLWEYKNLDREMSKVKTIKFTIEAGDSAEIQDLFQNPESPGILYYGDTSYAAILKKNLPGYNIYHAQSEDPAIKILAEKDIAFTLIDFAAVNAPDHGGTIYAFEHLPVNASAFRDINKIFSTIRERMPDVPVYFLDAAGFSIDDILMAEFVRKGAYGRITKPSGDFSIFKDDMDDISKQIYLHNKAASFAAESKVLSFETAPKLRNNNQEVSIRLKNFSVQRAVRGADSGSILDEAEKPDVCFDDVIGAAAAKKALIHYANFLKSPKNFTAKGLETPKGVLLYGPPGTGKTLLAKALAGESEVAFIQAGGSSFVTKWQGSGPEAVREIFARARRYAPSVLFIDEIDAIGRSREGGSSAHGEEMALNALLAEMDGFATDPKRPVFVLAATNFSIVPGAGSLGVIDAALARRFDEKILVDLPEQTDRLRYLELMIGKIKNHGVTPDMIKRLANRSTGLSLANLESVIKLAKKTAFNKGCPLNDDILEDAYETAIHGEEKEWGRKYMERIARHEAGHAYMCHIAGVTPAYLTIVARGGHGGYVEHDIDEHSPIKTKKDLLGRIRTALGGRAAEIVYYGGEDGLSTGAGADLVTATNIAYKIVCECGMDPDVGLITRPVKELLGSPIGGKIVESVSAILDESLNEAIDKISNGKEKMNLLVDRLLEKNKMTKEEIAEILSD